MKLRKFKDLSGKKFGEITAIKRVEDPYGSSSRKWLCLCSCGKEIIASGYELSNGLRKSCGRRCPNRKVKHGGCRRKERLYSIWIGMKSRCYNKNTINYHNYGGRGISICKEWSKSYAAFREWALSNGYEDGLSIDRSDNDGNYEPNNCRWVTNEVNNNNKRNNHMVSAFGEVKSIKEWSDDERCTVRYTTLRDRICYSKWGGEKAISTPVMVNR